MKKKIISLLISIALIATALVPSAFAAGTIQAADAVGTEDYKNANYYGQKVLENEDYIFVATGVLSKRFFLDGELNVYEKPNEDHMDYRFITTVTYEANGGKYNLPIRDMWLYDDVLYVNWGSVKTTVSTSSAIPGTGSKKAPLVSYDVSDLSNGITGEIVYHGSTTEKNANPYNRGGASYLDEDNKMLYQSVYSGKTKDAATMAYRIYDLANDEEKTLNGGSLDAVQFIVNDGYLFEVLHYNNGVSNSSEDLKVYNTVKIYNIADAENKTNISEKCLVGTYQTATEGDRVINSIALYGNDLYVATTDGLEIVDVTDALTADVSSPATLSSSETLHEDIAVNVVKVIDDKLYVGLATGMTVYDISAGMTEIGTYEAEGGFRDFIVNEDTNMLTALSGASKGNIMMINQDVLFSGLEISEEAFMLDGEETEAIAEGELSFKMKATNPSGKDISFKSIYLLYEGSTLVDAKISEWEALAGETIDVTDTVEVTDAEDSHVKVMLALNKEDLTLIPMNFKEVVEEKEVINTEFKIELGTAPKASGDASEWIEIGEADENGATVVSGNMADIIGKEMVVEAYNTDVDAESDRLSGIRYLDVVTIDEAGAYAFNLVPTDSGSYEATVKNPVGTEKFSEALEVEDAKVQMVDSIELPGKESYLCVALTNGQNVHKLNVEVTYDAETLTMGEALETSDEFEVSDVTVEAGTLTATITNLSKITKEANEFLFIPIKVASDAETKGYSIGLSATAEDKFESALSIVATSGTLTIDETSEKYDVLDETIEALETLKEADKIEVEEYFEQKEKIEAVREKVEEAYSYKLRDSQLGDELVANLEASEARLAEIKLYYDAIDDLEAAEEAEVGQFVADNKDYFDIGEDLIEIYEDLEDKSKADSYMADGDFDKPSDVKKEYTKAVILSAISENGWQKTENLLGYLADLDLIDLSDYNDLTENEKAAANKEIARNEYDSMEDLQDAIDDAIEEGDSSVTPGVSTGSGGSKNKSDAILVKPVVSQEEQQTPSQKEVFSDISAYGWAKDAIEYLYNNGVINGRGNGIFAPADNVTREEFAKMLSIAFDIKVNSGVNNFSDVDENAWYAQYVNALTEAGIVNGRGDGSFGIGDNITREEIAVMIERALIAKGITLEGAAQDSSDAADISAYAKEAINKMCANGIISGFGDGTVRPKENAQRAQTAQLIYKAIMLVK